MVFSSNVFLFLFLPIFLGLYYLSGQRYRNLLLLIASYIFYAWWRVDFLALFAGVTLWNYWIGLKVGAAGVRSKPAQRWLLLGVAIDLGILGYFKYANFGVDSLNAIMHSFGLEPFILTHVLLPIGISFYIFESISYIIDVYRGDTPATRNLIDFAAFVAIFPHLIAGPVLRFRDLADQFNNRTHTLDKFSEGATRFMQGFIKKVFIADTLAVVADHCFALQHPTTGDAWLGALAYTAQLYFDFSGYSDMAIGLGLMMGFRFMENFKQPYISQSITEFWRRWHISLSTWLRDYLYITLGGNRKGTLITYRNLFLTMLLGGLWHGANLTYIVWGAWHGVWLAIEKALGINTSPRRFNPIRWALTFLLVIMGWVTFRAENLHVAARMYGAMFSFGEWSLSELNRASLTGLQVATLVLAYATLAFFGLRDFYSNPPAPKATPADGPATAQPDLTQAVAGAALTRVNPPGQGDEARMQPGLIKAAPGEAAGSIHEPGYSVGQEAQVQPAYWVANGPRYVMRALVLLLFIASILKLSAQSFSPFLYFQF